MESGRAAVPVESRGLMYGDGCFETLRLYGGSFFKLGSHLRRLKEAAGYLGLVYPGELEAGRLKRDIAKLAKKNGLESGDAIARMQIWRGGIRGYRPQAEAATHYSLMVTGLPPSDDAITLSTVHTRRIPSAALPSRFKLCNNINYIAAVKEASAKGADDALMQTVEGYVSETTIANIFWIKGNTVYTPSESCDLLPGITRAVILELLKGDSRYRLREGSYRPEDLMDADAAWICNSVREIVPVARVNEASLAVDHQLLFSLKNQFEAYLKENLED